MKLVTKEAQRRHLVQSFFSANHTGVLVQESAVMQTMIYNKKQLCKGLALSFLWLAAVTRCCGHKIHNQDETNLEQ